MKRLATLLLFAILTAVPWLTATASDTRLQSLGGGEKVWTVDDEFGALLLPGQLLAHPNTFYVDGGLAADWARRDTAAGETPYDVGFGFYLALGEDTIIGFYGSSLSRYVSPLALSNAFGWAESLGDLTAGDMEGDLAINNADHMGTLVVAQRFGKVRTGLTLSLYAHSYEITEPANARVEKGGGQFDGRLGVGYDLSEKNSLDLAIGFSTSWFNDKMVPTEGEQFLATRLKGDPGWGIDVLGRGVFDLGKGTDLIPYVGLNVGGGGVVWNTGTDTAPTNELTSLGMVLGADLKFQPLEKVFLYPGLGLSYQKVSLDQSGENVVNDWTFRAPFVSVALDARLTSWFSLRSGVRQSFRFQSAYDGIRTTKGTGADTDFSLGVGFHVGQVDLDLRLNPLLLTEGPNIVSGKALDDGFALEAGLRFLW